MREHAHKIRHLGFAMLTIEVRVGHMLMAASVSATNVQDL